MDKKAVYEVKWVGDDGEEGSFARLTDAEAGKVHDFMKKYEDASYISELEVHKIEGYDFNRLMDSLRERAHGMWPLPRRKQDR